jgi:hypothetical protein
MAGVGHAFVFADDDFVGDDFNDFTFRFGLDVWQWS